MEKQEILTAIKDTMDRMVELEYTITQHNEAEARMEAIGKCEKYMLFLHGKLAVIEAPKVLERIRSDYHKLPDWVVDIGLDIRTNTPVTIEQRNAYVNFFEGTKEHGLAI